MIVKKHYGEREPAGLTVGTRIERRWRVRKHVGTLLHAVCGKAFAEIGIQVDYRYVMRNEVENSLLPETKISRARNTETLILEPAKSLYFLQKRLQTFVVQFHQAIQGRTDKSSGMSR